MKYLAVRTPVCNFAGTELLDNTKSGDDKVIRVQDILVQYLGQFFQAKDPKKVILAYKVGQKIYDAKFDSLELEDAEFELIEEALKEPKHSPMILGPIYLALEEAKKEAPKKDKD